VVWLDRFGLGEDPPAIHNFINPVFDIIFMSSQPHNNKCWARVTYIAHLQWYQKYGARFAIVSHLYKVVTATTERWRALVFSSEIPCRLQYTQLKNTSKALQLFWFNAKEFSPKK
jgi:hypothetical protein